MAGLEEERDQLVEDVSRVPLRSLKPDKPKMSLQQSVRDGREETLRKWLALLSEHNKRRVINAKDSFGFTAMHYAARFNRFKMMQLLIANNADPESRTEEGLTPLHYAARYTPLFQGDAATDDESAPVTLRSTSRQILQLLITISRVDVNVKDIYGLTPLHLACSRGNRVAVEILLSCHSIEVDIQDKKLDTPLHSACLIGDSYIVEKLLGKGANCLLRNHELAIPLHVACEEGHTEIVNMMMRCRFDQRAEMINSSDNDFSYPLHSACQSGNVEIAKVLFLNGADPNVLKIHDITPLHIAAREGFIEVAEVLLQYENSEINVPDDAFLTPLHYAARHNKVKMIKFLLKKGADIDSQDNDSYTPLLTAVAYGQLEAMDALIEAGASVDDVDRNGKSIVFIAAEENQEEVLKSLILGKHEETGNSLISTSDATHNTPLHIACKNGNLESVKVLLRASSFKIDARNEGVETPLHLAATNGHTHVINEMTRYANERELDVLKDEDDEGDTPLHLACSNGNYAAAKALLLAGADPEARNSRQWTPMDCSSAAGQDSIIQLLIDAEAEVDPKDIANTTPLQLACKEGHLKVVNLLLKNGARASICNSSGLNALDIAVENGQKDVAMAIIRSNQWVAALRNVTKHTSGNFTTPLRRIIMKMPDVAEEVFNRCCITNDDTVSVDDPDYKIEFNYEFLEDFRQEKTRFQRSRRRRTRHPNVNDAVSTVDDTESIGNIDAIETGGYQTSWGPEGYSRKDHCLQILANSKSVELLKHPLVANLLYYKWIKYGQVMYFSNLFIYAFFVIFLTAFALNSLSPTSLTCMQVFNGVSSVNCTDSGEISQASLYFQPVGAVFVILFAIIKLGFEAFQLIKFRLQYFLDWVNYLEIILFSFSIIFAFVFVEDCFCPRPWQWQMGAFAVFLAWIDLVIFIRKFPITGIYVVMFINIFYIFLKLTFLALLLILAFAFSFFMLFNDPTIVSEGFRTPFHDAWRSIVKTMTMSTGEFDFDTIFRQDGEVANSPDLQFPAVSYILWILFLILMPILFINLLVGLAVDDIKGMQESAGINRLALRVELTLSVEEYLPLWLRKRLIVGQDVIYPNRKLKPVRHFFYNVLGLFRFDSAENIKSALNAPPTPIEEVQEQNRRLSQQVDNLRQSMSVLNEQNERLMSIVTAIAENQGMIVDPQGVYSSNRPRAASQTPGRGTTPVPHAEKTISLSSLVT